MLLIQIPTHTPALIDFRGGVMCRVWWINESTWPCLFKVLELIRCVDLAAWLRECPTPRIFYRHAFVHRIQEKVDLGGEVRELHQL